MNKVILTDIDGVVLNWEEAFHKWMAGRGHTPVHGYEEMYGVHNIYDIPDALDLVHRFNESAAIGFLEPLRDAEYWVCKLRNLGYSFIGITAMGGDEYSQKLRLRNIEEFFPDAFIDMHFVGINGSKKELLTEFSQRFGDIPWIEDNYPNFRSGVKAGLQGFLMNHSYNGKDGEKGGIRVNTWEDIYNIVLGEEK